MYNYKKIFITLCLTITSTMISNHSNRANAAEQYDQIWEDGWGCSGFNLGINIAGDAKQQVIEVLPKTIFAGTGNSLIFTNITTGKTFTTESNGAVWQIMPNDEGTMTLTMTGHNIINLWPTDKPEGPSTTLVVGQVVLTYDSQGNTVLLKEVGKKTDICAALSD